MDTNFFTQVAALKLEGSLQIIIAQGAEGNYVVSVLLQNGQCQDGAKQLIPPLNLRGTPDELDKGFFENISQPLQEVSGLMVSMDAFVRQLNEAKKQSAMEKEKGDSEKKAKEEKERKYKDITQKVDELEKEGKYKEAWTKLPDPAEYPQYGEAIRKRKTELSDRFSPSLFGGHSL